MSDKQNRSQVLRFFNALFALLSWYAVLAGFGATALGLICYVWPEYWIADNMSFFQVQLGLVALAALVFALIGLRAGHRFRQLYRWALTLQALVFVGFVTLATSAILTLPKSAAADADVPLLRIVSINVRFSYLNAPALLDYVRESRPGVLVLEETGWDWQKQRLRRETGSIVPDPVYPEHSYIGDLGDVSVFSRFPILEARTIMVDGKPSMFENNQREIVFVRIQTPHGPVSIYGVHPTSPRTEEQHTDRLSYFDTLGKLLQVRPDAADPTIVIGDWNTSPWSDHFRRLLERHDLTTRFTALIPETTRFFRYFTLRRFFGATVDHVVTSPDLRIAEVSLGPDVGSDHIPLLADIVMPTR